ncbi:MAG: trypsin-like serine protease with C-terminal domain [Schlesneria sp.]|nr:trypsin-like serine protease with C-terminal domain [Schlesneria sp.]
MYTKLNDKRTLINLTEVYYQLELSSAGLRLRLVDACRKDPQSDSSRALSQVHMESVTRPQRAPPGRGSIPDRSIASDLKLADDGLDVFVFIIFGEHQHVSASDAPPTSIAT